MTQPRIDRRSLRITLAMIACILGLIGCCAAVLMGAPSSRDYKPASPWEQREMVRSTRSVYPDDVRANLAARRVPVAWAGILRQVEFIGEPARPMLRLTVEHHYFDWIEDRGAQRELYFLSPRGEGTFRCVWPLRREWDMAEMRRITVPGLMAVIYGTPERLDGAVIDLGQASYARLFPPGSYSMGRLDYGRNTPRHASTAR